MPPDTTASVVTGWVAPFVYKLLPMIPEQIIYGVVALLIAVLYEKFIKPRISKPAPVIQVTAHAAGTAKAEGPVEARVIVPPNPVHVVVPSLIGGIVAGLPGLAMGAVGYGLKAAIGALFNRGGR